jgi:hypothetical protein
MRLYILLDANNINLYNNYVLPDNRMHAGDIFRMDFCVEQ